MLFASAREPLCTDRSQPEVIRDLFPYQILQLVNPPYVERGQIDADLMHASRQASDHSVRNRKVILNMKRLLYS